MADETTKPPRDFQAEYKKRKARKNGVTEEVTKPKKQKARVIALPEKKNEIRDAFLMVLSKLDNHGLRVIKDRTLQGCKASLSYPEDIPELLPCSDGTNMSKDMFLHNCSFIVGVLENI